MVKCVGSRFVKPDAVKLVIFTAVDASTTIIVAQISNQRKDRHQEHFCLELLVKTLDLLAKKIAQIVFTPKAVKDQSYHQILMLDQSKLNEQVKPTI